MASLVVIAGPSNSGKMPLARAIVTGNGRLLVHRDTLRTALVNQIREDDLTWLMADIASSLLGRGYDVVAVAQNLEASDRLLWAGLACEIGVSLEWLDTRDANAHKLIPPLEGWSPVTR